MKKKKTLNMPGKRGDASKNQSSTSKNLKPDPIHGGLTLFGEVRVARLLRKELQPAEPKLQDPASRAVARFQSAAGVRCLQKSENDYVVKFNDWDTVEGYKKKFWIKFWCEEGAWKIGPYLMPTCFNKKKLEAANTGESLRIGRFLKDCKTLVECFTFRKLQFKQLKDFLESSDLYYAVLHADESYKTFTIRLQRKVENRLQYPSLIVVRLGYTESTTKPSSVLIESAEERELAERDREVLYSCFKVFKQTEVVEAVEQIFNSPESEEMWKRKFPALGERPSMNRSNRSVRKFDESSESDDSSQASGKNNEETMTSDRDKRSRLADDFSDVSDSEKQNSTSKTKRPQISSIGAKSSTSHASTDDRENKIAKNTKRKTLGSKKIAGAKVAAKRKKT